MSGAACVEGGCVGLLTTAIARIIGWTSTDTFAFGIFMFCTVLTRQSYAATAVVRQAAQPNPGLPLHVPPRSNYHEIPGRTWCSGLDNAASQRPNLPNSSVSAPTLS